MRQDAPPPCSLGRSDAPGPAPIGLYLVDFGGTLLEMLPMHVVTSIDAAELVIGRSLTAREQGDVQVGFEQGLSTVDVLRMALPDVCRSRIVSMVDTKRERIDHWLAHAILGNEATDLLAHLHGLGSVAIVSLGLSDEIERLLVRSGVTNLPRIYGRASGRHVVSKLELIQQAMFDFGMLCDVVLLIGDTEEDRAAARVSNIRFISASLGRVEF